MAIQRLIMPAELWRLLHRIAFADVWETVSMDANSITLKHRRKLSAELLPHCQAAPCPPLPPGLLPAESAAEGPSSPRMSGGCAPLGLAICFFKPTSHLRLPNRESTFCSSFSSIFSPNTSRYLFIHSCNNSDKNT